MAVPTGLLQRKDPGFFDSTLELRAAGAAAITSVGADFAAPDYQSAVFTIGAGQYYGKLLIRNMVLTLGVNAFFHIGLIGVEGSKERQLAGSRFGLLAQTFNDATTVDADVDIELCFTNSLYDTVFSGIRLDVVTGGTTISVDFTAHVGRLLVPS